MSAKPSRPDQPLSEWKKSMGKENSTLLNAIFLCFARKINMQGQRAGHILMGLEGTLEYLERCYDDGMIRISWDIQNDRIYMKLWNADTDNYNIICETNLEND